MMVAVLFINRRCPRKSGSSKKVRGREPGRDPGRVSYRDTASNAATFNETPEGVFEAFTAVCCATAAYRANAPDYAKHLKKATKKTKSV
jgi:hypothetical protein